ncbi:MAG TPA: cytochrome c oxidase subunit II [Bdellovibrionales bacterium]|nr:cytochrome c oxidase subunit II [Bdellovibrionales bacterium]
MSAASVPSRFMPPQATEIAVGVDSLYMFLLVASVISCVLVIGGLIYFAVKYRRQSDTDKTPYISHNAALEFLWSFIPFVIFMVAFVWGWIVFHQLRSMPENALEIAVEAQKWDWSFIYKNGRRSAAEFYVPVGQDVKLVMTSKDVLHSFFVPSFRNKQDVVPGRYTTFWFNAKSEGSFNIFCAEYCGDRHSGMLAKVHVVPREKYEDWLANDPYKGLAPADIGQKVYGSRCIACHTLTDSKNVGPGFKNVFGRTSKLDGGGTAVVDENYIRESIMNPNAKIVAGYPTGVMPTFAGQLSEPEIMGIIEYMKTVK